MTKTTKIDSKNVGDIRDGVVETLTSETTGSKTVYVVTKIRNRVAESRKVFTNEAAARQWYNM